MRKSAQQLLVHHGPVHEVVRPSLEGPHTVDRVGPGRADDDHRHLSIPGAARLTRSQTRAELELGEQDEIGTRTLRDLECLAVETRRRHLKAVARQLPLEVAPDPGIRLGEQQGGIHLAKLASGFQSHQMSFGATLRRIFPTCPKRSRRLWASVLGLVIVSGASGAPALQWQSHARIPEPRTEVAAALAGDQILVVGGFVESGGNSARADAYSVPNDRWARLPDLPVSVDHAAAASHAERVFVVGGYGSDRRPLRTAFAWDRGRWRVLAQLPEPRAAAAAAVSAGKLYVVGGVDKGGDLARVALSLDLNSGRWSRVPGPTPREHLAAAAARGRIYALGGRSAGIDTNTRAFESYHPATRRWTKLPRLPSARGGTGAATVSGRIVSVGGEQPAGTIASVYSFDLRSRKWRRLPDLPTPRHGLGVVAHEGRLFTLAGGPQPGLTVSGVVESLRVG